jgi:hypothetical protein
MSTNRVAPPSLTISVLDSYFSETTNLLDYVSERLDVTNSGHLGAVSEYLLRDADSPTYRSLVNMSYVATKASTIGCVKRQFKAYPPMMHMREVCYRDSLQRKIYSIPSPKLIDKAQEKLFLRVKDRSSNMITVGYRLVRS